MPKSRGRKATRKPRAVSRRLAPTMGIDAVPPIDGLVGKVVRGGTELLEVEDPFEAELWASSTLGSFYKLPLPIEVRDELEGALGPAIVSEAERQAGGESLAVLRALGAVADDGLAEECRAAAARLAQAGALDPPWAGELGSAELVDAWMLSDPYGDQEGYYATFRYPGRRAHMLMALYDENLGGIIKDAFAAYSKDDPSVHRARAAREPGARVETTDPEQMASRIVGAINSGDRYLDNDWTEDFKDTRALLLSRMRSLSMDSLPEPPAPLSEDARTALTQEFLASPFAPSDEEAASIVSHCLDARCDYGDGDPLRWSPIVTELFMLDFLPRKAFLNAAEIRVLPDVLRAWVRFALTRRGLEERWIAETEAAVSRFAPRFRQAATDERSFGPAKAITNAMLADGVDLTDQDAVDGWIEAFNARPLEERDTFLARFPMPDDPIL